MEIELEHVLDFDDKLRKSFHFVYIVRKIFHSNTLKPPNFANYCSLLAQTT